MKRNILFLLIAALAFAGCRSDDAPVYEPEYFDYSNCGAGMNNDARCGAMGPHDDVQMIQYSTPNGNDLRVETSRHVVQIDGQPNKKYDYYIWAGEKTYADDPDIIIQDGTASVLIEQ